MNGESLSRVGKMRIDRPATLKHPAPGEDFQQSARQVGAGCSVLGRATENLLRALKRDMVKKDGRVDAGKLRKDGYSDRLIARLDET